MPRGRPKKKKEVERVEVLRNDETPDKFLGGTLKEQIIKWCVRKRGYESLTEGEKEFVHIKAKKMIKAGYVMENGVPVKKAKI